MLDLGLLIVGIVIAFWFIGNLLGFLMMLMVAALVGFAAEAIVPGRSVSHGWLGAIGIGLIGSWIGSLAFGSFGPILMGVKLVPALLGTILLISFLTIIRAARTAN